MFYEIREYHIRDGFRDTWVGLMEDMILPFQKKMGMMVVGTFISLDDENVYLWIRRFESEDERKRLYDAVYGSDYWKQKVRIAMGDLLIRENIRVTRVVPTDNTTTL